MRSCDTFDAIYLFRPPVDMRKAVNGLSFIVEGEMDLSLFQNALFVFSNRRRDRMKTLYWNGSGFALWQTKLEKSRFIWPACTKEDTVTLSREQMNWLLRGFDICSMVPHKPLSYDTVS